jgi:hypothetical protein
MTAIQFEDGDFEDQLPAPGFYSARITTARFRKSASGNRMIQIVYELRGAPPGHDRVAEYFVVDGARAYALAMSRRKLVEVYHACGLEPRRGDEISPADLSDCEIEVKIDHDEWEGRPRLRVAGHRPIASRRPDGDVPF